MLFIDEAQDNSEEQSAILQRIFMSGDTGVTRQRFGDANQAIYDNINAKAATTDIFPDEKTIDIPNSYRFCQRIANLANPLAMKPIPDGLVGKAQHVGLHQMGSKRHIPFFYLMEKMQPKY